MDIFSMFKTGNKLADTVVDFAPTAAKGIDALFFTSEEKSQASMKVVDLQHKMIENSVNENSTKSVTRRILAWGIIGNAISLTWVGVFIHMLEVFGVIDKSLNATDFILKLLTWWGIPTTSVVIFYFGYYAIMNVIAGAKKK